MDWQNGFLCGLNREIPWESLELMLDAIDLGSGRDIAQAYERRRLLLRVFVLRHWLGLTPMEMELVLRRHDRLREFVGLGVDGPPVSAALIQQFELLLTEHGLKDVFRAAIPRALGVS